MADCVDMPGAIPPPQLSLYWQCKKLRALPNAGGLRDQPAALLRQMNTAGNVYEAYSAWFHSKHKQAWASRNPQGWRIIGEMLKVRAADATTE